MFFQGDLVYVKLHWTGQKIVYDHHPGLALIVNEVLDYMSGEMHYDVLLPSGVTRVPATCVRRPK